MNNYVISLISATERREHVTKEFGKHTIPFQFFDAITPNDLNRPDILELLPNIHQAKLSSGEKGCLLSHLALWKKCIDENLPYINIFEDDILLGENAKEFLFQDEWFFKRFDLKENFILRFETFLMPVKNETTDIFPYKDREFKILKEVHFGTAGYTIANQTAKFLLEKVRNSLDNKLAAIDELIFDHFLNELPIYQISPAICVQEMEFNKEKCYLYSQIQEERKKIRESLTPKVEKSLMEKIFRELQRPFRKEKAKKLAKIREKYIILFK
ncbi:glycosyltransferase family 25 protein [Rodentibacter ratti]|uniref:Glycosyl transferase family 25 domain-containing protein n=1 Tax=Rodentibacter ratti TaxID=1906745 RepID=A0A1V3L9P6_9PAST|nr:glycosyltransferase family 25 protein [Rodentibacter ratti]OOF86268.1 hypothetical protein BKG88_05395 [Rodentibacter ratti]